MAMPVAVANKPSFVEHRHLRFLIIDAPTDVNVEAYIKEFKAHNVVELVRACECGYSPERIIKSGVSVHDMPFPDGDPPPDTIITQWLALCAKTFAKGNPDKRTIAVHCVAGLGRAPVLVAIAMIEEGMEPLDAVAAIRAKRRGAINARQLHYLEHSYKKRGGGGGCVIM
jgi:protein tyrosine phosphatase type 4A